MDYSIACCVVVILVLISLTACSKNVLLIISDDLRPEIGAYYNDHAYISKVHPAVQTPNLDSLASKSILFKQAHVHKALCGPSRASFLTGRRPDTTKVHELRDYFRSVGGNFTTLPQFFKSQGYASVGMGKVFHPTSEGSYDPMLWSMPFFVGTYPHESKNSSWEAVPDSELINEPLIDQQIAKRAIQSLEMLTPEARRGTKPFFMAVGFRKPHLPFVFPSSFLQYYPEDEIHLPSNPYAPVNMPEVAWSYIKEIRKYNDIKAFAGDGAIDTTFPDNTSLALRRAYLCAVSYMDSLVGQVLGTLDSVGLRNNTIVAFVGDHGWQLGEHGEWGKGTNFELATHAPMMIQIPGQTDNGIQIDHQTEFVDLFPTLVEAAGFDVMSVCPDDSINIRLCRGGFSLLPYFDQPSNPLKHGAFSQYPRRNGTVMGYSLRTAHFRYTEWVQYSDGPIWNQIVADELYDHTSDPDENQNRAEDPNYSQHVELLRQQLLAGWRAAIIPQISAPVVG